MSKMYLIIALVATVSLIIFIEMEKPMKEISDTDESDFMPVNEEESIYPRYQEISNPSGFINSEKFTIGEHIGKKIILVDFWTYSCINCQRTLPYLNEWHLKYSDEGLLIVGIHTPEFKFEEDYSNVQQAVNKYNVKHPVVLDNTYSTWQAYKNRYWPRKYLIDIDGYIVYDHIGEGAYEETELKIQELLQERKERLKTDELITNQVSNPDNSYDVDFSRVKSPETYFGSQRNENLGNGIRGKTGIQQFTESKIILPNALYLTGSWNIQEEYAESLSDSKITFRYESKNVYMVASSDEEVKAEIYVNGIFVKSIIIKEEDLYSIVEGNAYSQSTLEIIVPSGLKVFTFTFG